MCGISGIFGDGWRVEQLEAMITAQHHRGPDAAGVYCTAERKAGLGHNRLSIIDLSPLGRQPMTNDRGDLHIVFNGEIYNYLELKTELPDYPYRSRTDTEVILAAYQRWGTKCLDHFQGMFAFLLWDERNQTLFAARDRFGVKPLYYHPQPNGTLLVASEIKALYAAGVPAEPDQGTWAAYLTHGLYEHSERTFWNGIKKLAPGCMFVWSRGQMQISRWYDLATRVGEDFDPRPSEDVQDEYLALLKESVRLRFRSDVPVGINLSGGLDSSILLGLVNTLPHEKIGTRAFTFITNDNRYDELPWVRQMLAETLHPLETCLLTPEDVPELAASVQFYQDEPFGGLPTLAYARLFEQARQQGVIVLLDGQGLDEQWAGYDYYASAAGGGQAPSPVNNLVQGTKNSPVRPECLTPDFRSAAAEFHPPRQFTDNLRHLQYRDTFYTKMPRALRFNDRVSMRASTELREPFLDHRLFELAFRQPSERKIAGSTQKFMLRKMAAKLLPQGIAEAPKRPVQTPQREWLRGPLQEWANGCVENALGQWGGAWLDAKAVRDAARNFFQTSADNSFYLWQWINLGLMARPPKNNHRPLTSVAAAQAVTCV